ncbi:MAG: pyruvate kinase alpha/beta domain-containing protein [Desulfotomaculaceae bacterium]|nr:pyruvate kinase alpha/beta domain-containing protein [Desulfotomaculaceae bacterium]
MYFEKVGSVNTEATTQLALEKAVEKNISHVVVASSRGKTAQQLANDKGVQIVCVRNAFGSGMPGGNNVMSDEAYAELQALGIEVVTATHVLSGVERGMSRNFGGIYPVEIIANTLRMFGQGTKVCVEIATMALDAGEIPYGVPVVAVAGSKNGADTVVVLTPAHANAIFDTKIHEVICKPSLY